MHSPRLGTKNLLVLQAVVLLLLTLVIMPRDARAEGDDAAEPIASEAEELMEYGAEDTAADGPEDAMADGLEDAEDSGDPDSYVPDSDSDSETLETQAGDGEPELVTQDGDSSDAVTVRNVRLYNLDGTVQTLSGDYDCQKRYVIVGSSTCRITDDTVYAAGYFSTFEEFSDINFLVLDIDGDRMSFESAFSKYASDRVRIFSSNSNAYNNWVHCVMNDMGFVEGGSLPFTVLIDKSNHVKAVFSGRQNVVDLCRTYLSDNESNPDDVDPGDPDQYGSFVPIDPNAKDELSFSIRAHGDTRSGRELLPLVNEARAAVGVGALVWDEELERTALQRGAELTLMFSHVRPDGSGCSTAWLNSSTYAGENIAWGQPNALAVNEDWTNSPGHYACMISERATAFAAAHFEGADGLDYWVECFGSGEGSGVTGAPTVGEVKALVNAIKGNVHLNLGVSPGVYSSTSGLYDYRIPTLITGQTEKLMLVAGAAGIDSSDVTWTSSDSSVLTIDETGRIVAVAAGSVDVTATLTTYLDLSVTKTITVEDGTYSKSGTWGTCPWMIDGDGTLWIYPGKGAMSNSFFSYEPVSEWIDYSQDIKAVRFVERDGQKVVMPEYCGYLFGSLPNLLSVDLSGADMSQTAHLQGFFYGCSNLQQVSMSGVDTSSLTSIARMFSDCVSLRSIDLSGLDVSNVTQMCYAFQGCTALEVLDVGNWNTSKVEDMDGMFMYCTNLASLNLSSWDTSSLNADNFIYPMFEGCKSLAKLTVGDSYVVSDGRIFPDATAGNGMWWSTVEQRWVSKDEILDGMLGKFDVFSNCEASTDELPTPIDRATLSVRPQSSTYTGSAIEPAVTVRLNGVTLQLGTDYSIAYSDNVNVGTATVIVTGKGNYAGTKTATFEIVAPAVSFRDVTEKTPHSADIAWLAASGVSAGWTEKDGSKTFRPTNTVIRQDMAAFLFRLAKSWGLVDDSWQPTGSVTFTDVNTKTPHYREIMWLAESGVSAGWAMKDGSREFRPTNTVVRQDMAAFLRRLQALRDPSVRDWQPTGASPFRDVSSKTPHYDDILWLAESGVSAGWTVDGAKEFRPTSTVIRQDMAAFLHRLDNLG